MDNHLILYKSILDSQNFFFKKMSLDRFEKKNIIASCMGINNPFFNVVLQTDVESKSQLISAKEGIEEFYKKYNVPWTWLVFPFSKPKNLDKILISQGLQELETFCVMSFDTRHKLPPINSQQYKIREVINNKDFDDWSISIQEGFKSSTSEMNKFSELTKNIPYGKNNDFHHYVLYVDDTPVASGTTSLFNKNMRFDNISVRPKYQRQGFGTAIIYYMMSKAKFVGAKYCFLDASYQGIELYKKLGFEECYTGRIFGKIDRKM